MINAVYVILSSLAFDGLIAMLGIADCFLRPVWRLDKSSLHLNFLNHRNLYSWPGDLFVLTRILLHPCFP